MLFARKFQVAPRVFRRCLSEFIVKATIHDADLLSGKADQSFPKFVFNHVMQNPQLHDKVAIVDGLTNLSLTFNGVIDMSYRVAAALRHWGLKKGEGVAIVSPNHTYYAPVFMGILLNGSFITTLNPAYTEHEIHHQLEQTNVRVVFAHSSCVQRI